MIPIKLQFKGLYSYREEQVIDFQKLTSSQLFGIFGSIGCGKSSILEAIMFALYDQSDRLKTSGDNRYYNMLNLQSDEMTIDLEFCLDASQETRYRSYFRASRNRNHYDQVSVRDRNLYRREGGQWLPLEDKDASGILGMSYANFMQTVIIPQAKFSEFVDQGVTQRTKMLKELYPLGKFELSGKTGSLLKKTQLNIHATKGQLLQIGSVSEEEIEHAKNEVKEYQLALAKNQQSCQKAENACKEQDSLEKLFDQMHLTRQELLQQEEQREHYQKRENQLKDYNRAVTHFNEKLNTLEDIRKEISGLRRSVHEKTQVIHKQEEFLEQARKTFGQKKQVYEQRDEKAQQCDDLANALEVRKQQAKLEEQKEQLTLAKKQYDTFLKRKESLQQQIKNDEGQLSQYEDKLKRQPELQQLSHWHETQNNLVKDQQASRMEEEKYAADLRKIDEDKAQLLKPYAWASHHDSFEKCRALLREQRETCQEQLDTIQQAMQELHISEKIASFAESLQEGSPCPLCGSTHHPEVAHHASVSQQLQAKNAGLQGYQEQEKKLVELQDKIQELEKNYDICKKLQHQATTRQQDCAEKLEQHQGRFRWKDFEAYEAQQINSFLDKLEIIGREADQLRRKLKDSREALADLDEKLQKTQQTQSEAQLEEKNLLYNIRMHKSLIKSLQYDNLERFSLPQLEENLSKGREQIKTAETAYEEAREQLHQREKELESHRSRLLADQERIESLELKAEKLDQEIQTLCFEKNFSGPEEVKELFELDLNSEEEQDAINLYKTRVASLQSQLEKLLKEAEGKQYHKHEHENIKKLLKQLKNEVEKSQQSCVLAQKNVQEMQEQLSKGCKLQDKLDKLERREENLKELQKLFKGSGFVKYASSVYLDNLCRTANERFMKLSRNNLSLELDEDNEFIVRDYLNNGKTRLLKTLSGGQTFQASLCLALALAENVKTLNQADQSFFFLDEGFGSLDRESLRVVFDTLKSLRQEKRIVGIISHVEELQQEIDVCLQIKNDKERGSLIRCSWE